MHCRQPITGQSWKAKLYMEPWLPVEKTRIMSSRPAAKAPCTIMFGPDTTKKGREGRPTVPQLGLKLLELWNIMMHQHADPADWL